MLQPARSRSTRSSVRCRFRRPIELLLILLFLGGLLLFPSAATSAVRDALVLCGTTLIPAIFPMLTVARFFVISGLSCSVGRRLSPLFRPLIGLSSVGCGVFAAGFLCGFPAGAAMVADAYEAGELRRADAERLLAFTNNPSPAFLLFFVGKTLFGSIHSGALLLFCQIAAVLTVAVATAQLPAWECSRVRPPVHTFAAFARAVSSAATASLQIVGFVGFFSVAAALCEPLFLRLPPVAASFFHALLELSGGLPRVITGAPVSLPLAAFFLSFCGFSVHAQVVSLTPQSLSLRPYICLRLFIMAASVCYTGGLTRSLPLLVRLFLWLLPMSLAALLRRR